MIAALLPLLLIVVAGQEPSATEKIQEERMITFVKGMPAKDFDASLPKMRLERWLMDVAGKGIEIQWSLNDCGEQTGDPAVDSKRDIPACVGADAEMPNGRSFSVQVQVGTFGGKAQKPKLRAVFVLAAKRVQELKKLGDLPKLLTARKIGMTRASTAEEVLRHLAERTTHGRRLSAPQLHALAKRIGKNHERAVALWSSGVPMARLLAALTDEPQKVTARQMDRWVRDFDSWDVTDCCCCYLFSQTESRWGRAVVWSRRREEFVRRAGFALMAYLAYKDKAATHAQFRILLPLIEAASRDHRHFVKTAVNWALRNIGKRNRPLNAAAVKTALRLQTRAESLRDSAERSAALWIASDALRELRSPAVQRRLAR